MSPRHRGRWIAVTAVIAVAVLVVGLAISQATGDDEQPGGGTSLHEAVARARERLDSLASYSYESLLEVELPGAGGELGATSASVEAAGEVVPPDRLHHLATTTLGPVSAEEELVRVPEGDFIKRPQGYTEGLGELNTFIVSPPALWSDLAAVVQLLPEDASATTEEINGQEATRYTMEEVRLLHVKDYVLRLFGAVESADVLPDFYRVDVWVSDGVLLRLEINGEAIDPQGGEVRFHLESTISDMGDDFAIELE